MSNVKVFVLMAAMTALLVVVGGALGGTTGMWVAFGLAAVMNFFAWFNSDKAALRAFGARVVSEEQAPELYAIVDRLRQRAGLPMPRLAVAPQPQPIAFASGRNAANAVVCVTDGLLQTLDLADALAKINAAAKRIPMRIAPTMAPLAQVDPLQAFGGGIGKLFSTHPPVEERIARLRAMAREQAPASA